MVKNHIEKHSLHEYADNLTNKLKRKKKHSMIIWMILTLLVSLGNIALIIVMSLALNIALNSQEAKTDFTNAAPTIILTSFVIFSFVLGFIVTIYQGLMRSRVYKYASERIQYSTLKWVAQVEQYEAKNRDEIFRNKIIAIENDIAKVKGKWMIKKALIKILTGGKDE